MKLLENKALLFINGEPPEKLPNLDGYNFFACTDGAFHYLKQMDFPLHLLDFISGDFDSHSGNDNEIYSEKFIHTPDQNKTDFEKSLEILLQKNVNIIDVYGGSGGEMDHFLGNLTVAFTFKEKMKIHFFDAYSQYFFIPNKFKLKGVKGKLISLYPFPKAQNVNTQGLNWSLNVEDIDITSRIGTRNFAVEDDVSVSYSSGDILIFIGDRYL